MAPTFFSEQGPV